MRRRILLLTHGLPPDDVGGVEQHVDGLARELVALGHDVHVWAKTGRAGPEQGTRIDETAPDAPYRTTRVVYRYEGLEGFLSLYRVPLLEASLADFLDERPAFDVAHIHHFTGLSTGIVDVLRARGVATVVTLHDYWSLCPRGQMWSHDRQVCDTADAARCVPCLARTFGGWIPEDETGVALHHEFLANARHTLATPDVVLLTSDRARPPFAALGVPDERMRPLENGVDVRALRALPPPDVEADRPLRLGYLGTLIPSKGLDVLVAALREVPADRVELHIHGNAVDYHGDTGFLNRVFTQLKPGMRVTYHGPYPMRRLPEVVATLDVIAAPALWRETFGLTIREALAAARPVIASRIGGLQDAIEDGVAGRVVPPGDVAALRDAILDLESDRARLAAMSRAARALPVRGFPEMAAEMVGVYEAGIELARGRANP